MARLIFHAKSIPAKKFGIKTGEPVAMDLRKCPDLFLTRPDFRLYEGSSKAFMDICWEYATVVEEYSIDECFLDMSGTHKIYPDPVAIAHTIKDKIRDSIKLDRSTQYTFMSVRSLSLRKQRIIFAD